MFTNNVNTPLKNPHFFVYIKKPQTLYLAFKSIFYFQTIDKAVKMPILIILNIKNEKKIKFENCELNSCLGFINCVHSVTCINLIIKCIVDK